MYLCAYRQYSDQCVVHFDTPEALFLHIRTCHSVLTHYVCGQEACGRTFQRLDSFQRHITNLHTQQRPLDVMVRPEVIQQPFMGDDLIENDLPPQIETINIADIIEKIIQRYLSTLYRNKNVTRKTIQEIIDSTGDLLSNVWTILGNFIPANDKTHEHLKTFLNQPFFEHNTEYKRMKSMKRMGFFIAPEKVVIRQRVDEKTIDGRVMLVPVEVTLSFIPLRTLFNTIFSLPNVFQIANSYLYEQDQNVVIDDFGHSPFWKSKRDTLFRDKFVVPLYIYYDEFECNNPLGSHARVHKLGAVYVSLRCFPIEF